jgi:hypothetical protein
MSSADVIKGGQAPGRGGWRADRVTENNRIPIMLREALDAALRGIALAASVALIAGLAGCGGDDGESESTAAGAESAQAGGEQIEGFGEEAGPTDRDAATEAVRGFLRVWADGDGAKACSLMAASTKKNLEEFSSQFLKTRSCTEQVEALTSRIPAKTLAQAGRIEVTGFRIEGERGFVIYRDGRGTESAFPVEREGSAWKVAAIAGQSLP